MDNSTFGYPDALGCGDGVSEPYSEGSAVLGTDVGGGGLFTGEGLKYLGLNIQVAGESQRGWISLEVSAGNDTIFLHEVGYALEIGEGITAGQTSAQIDEPLCDFVYTIGSQSEPVESSDHDRLGWKSVEELKDLSIPPADHPILEATMVRLKAKLQ